MERTGARAVDQAEVLLRRGPAELIGRADERAAIDALLDGARLQMSGVLLLVGEPGIGKSRLLNYAAAKATDMLVLRTVGVDTELELHYGALGRLLRPLQELVDRASVGYADILRVVLGLDPPSSASGELRVRDRFTVGAATLSLLAAAADDQPVLVLLDDAQWADEPSIEALAFAARRLLAEGIVVIFGCRSGEVWPALTDFPDWPLTGLGHADAAALLRQAAAERLDDRQVAAIVQASGGNPLALVELPRVVEGELGRRPVHAPLPVSERLQDAFGRRVQRHAPATRQALLVAAVLEQADGIVLQDAMRASDLSADALLPAEDDGLIELRSGTVVFRHPLVRAAIIQMAVPSERRRAQRAAAEALAASVDPADATRRAWHLAASVSGLDDDVAQLLDEAAVRALDIGGFATASNAWERSAELTTGYEPRARRFLGAAEAAYQAAHGEGARRLLLEAERLHPGREMNGEINRLYGRLDIAAGRPDRAHDRLTSAASTVDDPVEAAQLLLDAVVAAAFSGKTADMLRAAERARELADGDPVTSLIARLAVAAAYVMQGRSAEAIPLMDVDDLLASVAPTNPDVLPYISSVAFCKLVVGLFSSAERLIDAVIDAATNAGATAAIPFPLALRADVAYRRGAWDRAVAVGWQAVDMATQTGRTSDLATAHNVLAAVAAGQARREDCRSHADACIEYSHATQSFATEAGAHGALGLLELGAGRPEDALVHLGRAEALCRRLGLLELAHFEWAAETVEAHTRAGSPRRAEATVDLLRRHADRARRPIADGLAARCEALLATDPEFPALFESAVAHHLAAGQPFELARTRLCFGERLRRSKQRSEARRELEAALSIFLSFGAEAWAARARRELEATGLRVAATRSRHADALTAQELQIATAASGDLSNREVAAQLFLSPKTIEYHLSHVYRKLGIDSRRQLREALQRVAVGVG